MTELNEAIRQVCDEDTFLSFLRALRADWLANSTRWENPSFDAFFESAVSWAEDSRTAPQLGAPSSNPWRRCAEILRAGTRYE